jgi:hypothetical protein
MLAQSKQQQLTKKHDTSKNHTQIKIKHFMAVL